MFLRLEVSKNEEPTQVNTSHLYSTSHIFI